MNRGYRKETHLGISWETGLAGNAERKGRRGVDFSAGINWINTKTPYHGFQKHQNTNINAKSGVQYVPYMSNSLNMNANVKNKQ